MKSTFATAGNQQLPSDLSKKTRESRDTDAFDATYLHLFLCRDIDSAVVGAYRLGQTDTLIDQTGVPGLYLSSMFEFGPRFQNRTGPCLELGRSFLIPEYQKSAHGLLLLWQGIGAWLSLSSHVLCGSVCRPYSVVQWWRARWCSHTRLQERPPCSQRSLLP